MIRLLEIKGIFHTASDFFKLEKIEFGGIRGRHLNQRLHEIQNEFQSIFNACISIDYNPLDPLNTEFNQLKKRFQSKTGFLERKLAQTLCDAFDSCCGTESNIKLIEMIGSLAQRPIINKQIAVYFEGIIEGFQEDLNSIEQLFNQHLNCFTSYKNESEVLCFLILIILFCSSLCFIIIINFCLYCKYKSNSTV